MGLIDQFGFEAPVTHAVQQAMRKVSSSRPGAWLFAKVLHHVDNLLLRATRGRTSVPRLLARTSRDHAG